jgi:diaminopimelate epimerase
LFMRGCGCGGAAWADRSGRERPGGILRIDWRDDGVWMTGPTMHVFDGVLSAAFLQGLL